MTSAGGVYKLFQEGVQSKEPEIMCERRRECNAKVTIFLVVTSGVPRGGVWGVQPPPPRNSEDIGGFLDRISKKNRRLDFLL